MPMSRRPRVRPLLTVGLVAGLIVGAAASQAQEGTSEPENPTIAAFEALRSHIAEEVRQGRLPASAESQAEEIGFELEADRIRTNADIQVLMLEVRRFTGERQETALTELVRAVAARERQLFDRLRQLEKVAGVSAPMAVMSGIGEPKKKDKDKKGKIELESKPEDLSKGANWPL